MQKNNTVDRTKLFNIMKFFGAVIIFYLGFKLCIPSTIKEDFVSENMYEGREVNTADEIDDNFKIEIGRHEAPTDTSEDRNYQEDEYAKLFQNICVTNQVFCDKVLFNGSYSIRDKYIYLASVIYILRFIENNVQIGLPIKKQLNVIVINDASNTRRGYANWDTITLNLGSVSSYAEFMELVSHEMGHIVDLGMVRGYSLQKDYDYTEFGQVVFASDDPSLSYYAISWDSESVRNAESTVADFCSSYGMSDPFEDFAECHNLYLNHNAIFKVRAQNNVALKQKYNFFANLYGGRYLFDTKSDLGMYATMVNVRPWDTTKM